MVEANSRVAMHSAFPVDTLDLSNLDLDLANSRYPRDATSQDDAMLLMMTTSGEQCMELLRDLTRSGAMSSADIPIVVQHNGRYTVLEGNRRLTCLRLWTDPSLLSKYEELEDRFLARVQRLVSESSYLPPTGIRVTIAPTNEAADNWIDRKHSGGAAGMGTVEWGAAMKDRRRALRDPGKRSRALAFVERVATEYEKDIEINQALEEVRTKRYTMIQRFVNRSSVRDRLGIAFTSGEMTFEYGATLTKPIIRRVLFDFARPKAASGKTWARELDTVDDFDRYLAGYKELLPGRIVRPIADDEPDEFEPAASTPSHEASDTAEGRGDTGSRNPFAGAEDASSGTDTRPPRPTIKNDFVLRGLRLDRFTNRIQEIVRQTSIISVTRNTEVVSVMLRVILDLACYQYLKSHDQEPDRHLDRRIKAAIKLIEPTASDALGEAETTSALAKAFHATTSNGIRLVQYAVHDIHSGQTPNEVLTLASRYTPLLISMNENMGSHVL